MQNNIKSLIMNTEELWLIMIYLVGTHGSLGGNWYVW